MSPMEIDRGTRTVRGHTVRLVEIVWPEEEEMVCEECGEPIEEDPDGSSGVYVHDTHDRHDRDEDHVARPEMVRPPSSWDVIMGGRTLTTDESFDSKPSDKQISDLMDHLGIRPKRPSSWDVVLGTKKRGSKKKRGSRKPKKSKRTSRRAR